MNGSEKQKGYKPESRVNKGVTHKRKNNKNNQSYYVQLLHICLRFVSAVLKMCLTINAWAKTNIWTGNDKSHKKKSKDAYPKLLQKLGPELGY